MSAAYPDAMSVEDKAAPWIGSLQHEDSRGKRTLVVEAEGCVLGYATVGPDEESIRGLLYLMYVLPGSWGRGVGRALMEGARQTLVELGHDEAVLWVLEANERARRFYGAAGWLRMARHS